MCGGRGGDNSAEIARLAEEKRQARISDGTLRVDDAFKGFDNGFYDRVSTDYLDNYTPLLKDQYDDARESAIFRLADQGGTNSSAGAKLMADLFERYSKERNDISQRAVNASKEQQTRVANNRGTLISQLESGGSVETAANNALNSAKSLNNYNTNYKALENVFADAVDNYSTYRRGANLATTPTRRTRYRSGNVGNGNGRVVR